MRRRTPATPRGQLNELVSRLVFDKEHGPLKRGPAAAAEGVVPRSHADAARRIEALVAQGACEQALLFTRQQGLSPEASCALFGELLRACEWHDL